LATVVCCLVGASASAQTKPTPEDIQQWLNDPKEQVLESVPCKRLTWILASEAKLDESQRQIHFALGWWARGFAEGATFLANEKAQNNLKHFGLSVVVAAAHIATYCATHETETPFDAVQDLVLKAIR